MKILHLVLTEHWYDETAAGRKSVEYRRIDSPKWKKEIWERREQITHVRFQRGFKKNPPKMLFEVEKIDIGPCPIDGWDGDYFRIHSDPASGVEV
jgi:hypothetical protein